MTNQTIIELNDKMKMPTRGFGVWKVSNQEAPQILDLALAAGYRSIDTAAVYGNEEGVGLALKATTIPREEIFLTTKVWNTSHGYDTTLRAMDESLKNLQTSYVDLYLIHWPKPQLDKYIGTWKALVRLRNAGLAKSIGVSNFNIDHLERLINETGIVPAVNQIELHPHFQQKELREFHDKHGIVTIAWSPLARGKFFENSLINNLSIKYKKSPAQIVLRWHLDNQIVAIPKSVTPSRILDNFNILDFQLTIEELEQMSTLDDINGRTGPNPMTAEF